MAIKDLGRWESLEMVQRYTRSGRFGNLDRPVSFLPTCPRGRLTNPLPSTGLRHHHFLAIVSKEEADEWLEKAGE